MKKLHTLLQQFPLPITWSDPEVFEDQVNIDELKINVVGLCSKDTENRNITASAASLDDDSYHRAYFELLERTCTQEFFDQHPSLLEKNHLWCHSKSNGIAAHTELEQAKQSAYCELIERDRFLRAWFSGSPPTRLSNDLLARFSSYKILTRYYDLILFSLDGNIFNDPENKIHTVGLVGFPKNGKTPFIFGLSSRPSLNEAIQKAHDEFLQRLAFLWGEETSTEEPAFEPTPLFHQEYFLRNAGILNFKNWMNGSYKNDHLIETFRFSTKTVLIPSIEQTQFIDITPTELQNQVFIIKAENHYRLPLFFGKNHPRFKVFAHPNLEFHPIA